MFDGRSPAGRGPSSRPFIGALFKRGAALFAPVGRIAVSATKNLTKALRIKGIGRAGTQALAEPLHRLGDISFVAMSSVSPTASAWEKLVWVNPHFIGDVNKKASKGLEFVGKVKKQAG